MILMISSDGMQNNIFLDFCSLPIAILSDFQVAAIGLPTIVSLLHLIMLKCSWKSLEQLIV